MDLADMVQELTDRQAIANVIHLYCNHFDMNQPDQVAALFTQDARVDYGPDSETLQGPARIAEQIAEGLENTFAATSHHVSNIEVTFEGPNAARSLCYLYAWHQYRDGSPDGELWAQYHHRLVRTEDGWRIRELQLRAAGMRNFHRERMHPIGRR